MKLLEELSENIRVKKFDDNLYYVYFIEKIEKNDFISLLNEYHIKYKKVYLGIEVDYKLFYIVKV